MAESPATPRPWSYKRSPIFNDSWAIFDSEGVGVSHWQEGRGITTGKMDEMEPNAELIVKSVNAHDDLVAMCDEMAEFLGTQNLYPQYVQDIREQLVTRCRKLLASLEPNTEEEER